MIVFIVIVFTVIVFIVIVFIVIVFIVFVFTAASRQTRWIKKTHKRVSILICSIVLERLLLYWRTNGSNWVNKWFIDLIITGPNIMQGLTMWSV